MLMIPVWSCAADYVPKILAGVVKSDSWTMDNNQEGIYQLEVKAGGQLTAVSTTGDAFLAPLGGAVYVDGTMKGIHFKQEYDPYDGRNNYTIYHVQYDMQTWERTKAKAMDNTYANLISSCGIAHDPETGLDFGIFYNFNFDMQVINRKLATIDFSTDKPQRQIIDVVETPFAAIAFHPAGVLFGMGQDGWLYAIDKTTAEIVPLGDTGISNISTYPSSMVFDPNTNKIYWSYVNTSMKSQLYEIEYANAQVKAVKVMDVPDNAYLVNMYIAPMTAGAPAAAKNLMLLFDGERMTGTVAFTMPTQTQDEEPLSGTLNYTIYANGEAIANGTAEAGTTVTKDVTVPTSGDTEISVVVSNDKGESPAIRQQMYIGRDTPLAVTDLHLFYNTATGKAELTWTAPQKGTHDKTLTPANLTYNVVRQPGDITVATATPETSFMEALDNTGDLKSYYYEVTAVNGELAGEKAASNTIVLGDALELPFSENFMTQAGFDRFTVVDANNDTKTWKRFHKYYEYSGTTIDCASIIAHYANADDDYLLTPMLRMERGSRYALTFKACKTYSPAKYDQKMEVLFGQGDDLSTYQTLMTCDIDDVNETLFEQEIVPEADGIYRVAFHAISDAGSDELRLMEVKIAAPMAGTAPLAVTGLKIIPDAKGELTAKATMTAPTKNVRGEALTTITKIEAIDRSGAVVGTVADVTPGEAVSIDCTGLQNGYNTLTVIPYVGDDAGEKAAAEAFVGVDRPLAPTDVLLGDNGSEAVVTWTAPGEVGYFGHYVNPDALRYNLYTISDDGYADPLQDNISQPYNTGEKTNVGDQHLLYYALSAESVAGEGPLVATNSLVVGESYPLPFHETFASGLHTNQFIWFEGEQFDKNFKLVANAADGDNSALSFTPNYALYGIFSTGKISLVGAERPVFSFWHYVEPGEKNALLVYIDRQPQSALTEAVDIDYSTMTEAGWQKVEIDLANFKQYPYVILRFGMVATSENYTPVIIDDIQVYDAANPSGIDAVQTEKGKMDYAGYNVAGQRVGAAYKGIVIRNGRKQIVR